MEIDDTVCTRVCTSEPKMGDFDPLESLATALRESLPAENYRQLAMLLEARDDHQRTDATEISRQACVVPPLGGLSRQSSALPPS